MGSYLPMILWMAFISYLSHKTSDELPKDPPYIIRIIKEYTGQYFDKVGHFGLYFILGLLSLKPFLDQKVRISFFCILFGLIDETHQYFIPGRHFDLLDWMADTIGVSTAFIMIYCLEKNNYFRKPTFSS